MLMGFNSHYTTAQGNVYALVDVPFSNIKSTLDQTHLFSSRYTNVHTGEQHVVIGIDDEGRFGVAGVTAGFAVDGTSDRLKVTIIDEDQFGAHLGLVIQTGDILINGATNKLIKGADATKGVRKPSPLATASKAKTVFAKSLDEQMDIISDAVPGLGKTQAKALLEAARRGDVGVVLGGSRVKTFFGGGTFKETSDLDIGFTKDLNSKQVKRILKSFDTSGPLRAERNIQITPGNRGINSAEEFFQRTGVRHPEDPKGFFVPSGSITIMPDGNITFRPPAPFDFRNASDIVGKR